MGVLLPIIGVFSLIYFIWICWTAKPWYFPKLNTPASKHIGGLSIIIPFRNEKDNLAHLLEDLLRQQTRIPFEIILCNDHSTDGSEQFNFQDPRIRMIHLADEIGKKAALRAGIDEASFAHVATLDADVRISQRWIESLSKAFVSTQADMLILPLCIHDESGLFTRLQSLEFASVLGVTGGMAAQGVPVLCNGANLAFTRDAWYKTLGKRSDHHVSSGDDIFLLEQLAPYKKISWVSDLDALATCKAEKNIESFFSQRVRWTSKTLHYRNTAILLTGALVAMVNLIHLALIISTLFKPSNIFVVIAFQAFKFITDAVLIIPVLNRTKQLALLKLYPLVSVLYPFYSVSIPLAGLFVRPVWKGRKIER